MKENLMLEKLWKLMSDHNIENQVIHLRNGDVATKYLDSIENYGQDENPFAPYVNGYWRTGFNKGDIIFASKIIYGPQRQIYAAFEITSEPIKITEENLIEVKKHFYNELNRPEGIDDSMIGKHCFDTRVIISEINDIEHSSNIDDTKEKAIKDVFRKIKNTIFEVAQGDATPFKKRF